MLTSSSSFYKPKGDEFRQVAEKLSYNFVDFSNGLINQNFIFVFNNVSMFKGKFEFCFERLKFVERKFTFLSSSKKLDVKATFNRSLELFVKDVYVILNLMSKQIKKLVEVGSEINFGFYFDENFLSLIDFNVEKFDVLLNLFAKIYSTFRDNPNKVSSSDVSEFVSLYSNVFLSLISLNDKIYEKFCVIKKSLK